MGLFDRFLKKDSTQEESKLVPGVGRLPYPAYRGREPYIFVSYAHADSARVFKEIARLNEVGFHVWYDEGIAPGNEWTDEIADALAKCSVFVVMLTPVSAPRENVQNEINFALDEKKPFLAVHLEETTLRRGLKLQIGTKQAILKYNMSEDEYLFKMTEALTRFGLKGTKAGNGNMPQAEQAAGTPQKISAPQPDRNIPPQHKTEVPLPEQQEPAAKPSGYTLSPEARMRMERTMNAEVRDIDFEWIGSTLKGFHGIQKRVAVPLRASGIMSHAFSGLPVEYIVLHKGISRLDFAAFNKCSNLKQVIIESPQIEINFLDDPVSPIGAFYQCPQVIVYCHKDSAAYEELKRTHKGEIRFIEDMEEESSS